MRGLVRGVEAKNSTRPPRHTGPSAATNLSSNSIYYRFKKDVTLVYTTALNHPVALGLALHP